MPRRSKTDARRPRAKRRKSDAPELSRVHASADASRLGVRRASPALVFAVLRSSCGGRYGGWGWCCRSSCPRPAQVAGAPGRTLGIAASSSPISRISIYRITVGFLISTAFALPIGMLIGCYRGWEAAIEPLVDFIRYMPVVAFVPLTILWTGTGDIAEVPHHLHRHLLPAGAAGHGQREVRAARLRQSRPHARDAGVAHPDAHRRALGDARHLGFAAHQPRLGLDLAGRRRAGRRDLRPRLSHHHGAALLPDRSHLRLHPAARHARPRHRPGDEGYRAGACSAISRSR